jgi:hypothetical protein
MSGFYSAIRPTNWRIAAGTRDESFPAWCKSICVRRRAGASGATCPARPSSRPRAAPDGPAGTQVPLAAADRRQTAEVGVPRVVSAERGSLRSGMRLPPAPVGPASPSAHPAPFAAPQRRSRAELIPGLSKRCRPRTGTLRVGIIFQFAGGYYRMAKEHHLLFKIPPTSPALAWRSNSKRSRSGRRN